jgi:hypothetical protein
MAKWLAILMAIWQIAFMTTHRRHANQIPAGYVILFCDSDRNEGYGDHVWELMSDLPSVESLAELAEDFYGVDADEAMDLINPADIVSTAGAWDDTDWVSAVQNAMDCGMIPAAAGYTTHDGAVVIDRDGVELVYTFDAE